MVYTKEQLKSIKIYTINDYQCAKEKQQCGIGMK